MALNLKEMPSGTGGWLKPEDHENDVAILVEVKGFTPQRPSNFGPKDSIIADVTFFAARADLDALTPTKIALGMRIEYTVLTSDLHEKVGIGGATIVTLGKAKPKAGQKPAWIWNQVTSDVTAKVVEYADQRDAALNAAIADAPDFD